MTYSRIRLGLAASGATLASVVLLLLAAGAQDPVLPPAVEEPGSAYCLSCHQHDISGRRAVDAQALAGGPHRPLSCQSCHSTITAVPHTAEMMATKATCSPCHGDAAEAYRRSPHSRVDIVAGDHPTCISCHATGADPHAIVWPEREDRRVQTALCAGCHRDEDRMARYGVNPDATPTYEDSFHGKALLRFGMDEAATCIDCHRHHDVLPSTDPAASTHDDNVVATCAQPGCHPDANATFAMSGMAHPGLMVQASRSLQIQSQFFHYLTLGTILLLMAGVGCDLRTKVFARGPGPASGRLAAALISISFMLLVAALAAAYFGHERGMWSGVAALMVLGLAVVAVLARPRKPASTSGELIQRFTAGQRWQHATLAISFTLLVLTGLPLKFAHIEWLHPLYAAFGGIDGARLIHRIAGVIMIVTWVWHTVDLLVRWRKAGWTFRSWSMFPNRKDFADFYWACRFYLGLAKEGPKHDRYEFRGKFHYFAVCWGTPIMVLTGLVLWFPVYASTLLPETGLVAAQIAHSHESILAMLAVLIWHFYNAHFNPDHFPMNPVWFTGTKTREQMERDHPLELARLDAAAKAPSASEPPKPAPADPA